jgi:hypothetical protein
MVKKSGKQKAESRNLKGRGEMLDFKFWILNGNE